MKLKTMAEILAENPGHVFGPEGELVIPSDFDTRLIIKPEWFTMLGDDLFTKFKDSDLKYFTKAPEAKKKALAYQDPSGWIEFRHSRHPLPPSERDFREWERVPEFDIEARDL